RNTIFLSFALSLAESIEAFDIFMGGNRMDRDNYPDCTAEYLESFEAMANQATGASRDPNRRFRFHAPLSRLDKGQTIQLGLQLGVNYGSTSSCYDPSPEGTACGHCLACHLRIEGFKAVGVRDPIPYQNL
ncbi:MAG: 7-cyano-7-deazaguanine synthase, partial [Bdellovibrio sp.]|nr:7-cyano-7-deazaguanine synthase [Bdellovibrio sp.]